MDKITIRKQRVSDARRFFEILSAPGLKDFGVRPKSVEDEIAWLEKAAERSEKGYAYDYTILLDGKNVGGIGINIDQHRNYIAEIGYFVDENYWGKGIATQAVKLLEKLGFEEFGLQRIEIRMNPKNIASEKVAIRSGYKKEGLLLRSHKGSDGKCRDSFLYAKINY